MLNPDWSLDLPAKSGFSNPKSKYLGNLLNLDLAIQHIMNPDLGMIRYLNQGVTTTVTKFSLG